MREVNQPDNIQVRGIEFLLLVIVAGVLLISFLRFVIFLGQFIPQDDIVTDYLFAVGWAAVLGLSITIWPIPAHHKPVMRHLWIARCIMTLVVMLVTEYYFETRADYYRYFLAGRADEWLGWHLVGDERVSGTNAISAIVWLIRRVLPDSYHALKVTFSFFGLVSIYFFYRAAVAFLQHEHIRFFYVLGLFPSLLFWSSIIGKEPVTLLGVALYTYGALAWYRYRSLHYLLFILVGIALTTLIRPWMAFIMGTPLILFFLGRAVRGWLHRVLFLIFVVVVLSLSWGRFKAGLEVQTFDDVVARANLIAKNAQEVDPYAGSTQRLSVEFHTASDIVTFVPMAAFTALFRPLPGELWNPFGILAGIENAWLLVLIVLSFKRSRWRDISHPVILWAILLLAFWAVVYGFVSAYNLGTGMRYRQQIFPILLGVLLYLSQRKSQHFTKEPAVPAVAVQSKGQEHQQ